MNGEILEAIMTEDFLKLMELPNQDPGKSKHRKQDKYQKTHTNNE